MSKITTEIELIERINFYWKLHDDFQVNTDIAALLLKKSPSTLKAWRTRGVGPEYVRGSPVTYSIGDLKQYLKDQKSRRR